MTARRTVLAGFCLAALLTAGGLSYLASPAPDGLDAVTQLGCSRDPVAQVPAAARGTGDAGCIAGHVRDSPLARGPLAGYGVAGHRGLTGAAGVIGVLVTLALAAGLFRLLRRDPSRPVSGNGRPAAGHRSPAEPAGGGPRWRALPPEARLPRRGPVG
jgi:cobalt/nickel transport protein